MVIKMVNYYQYDESRLDKEIGWLKLRENYWGEEARKEIENAINEAKVKKQQPSLESWIRDMLQEQR